MTIIQGVLFEKMKKLSLAFVLLIVALAAQDAVAQSKKEKDRASFISNAKLLEKKPFDPNAATARANGDLSGSSTRMTSL